MLINTKKFVRTAAAALAVIVLAFSIDILAQTPFLWGSLEPGKYSVGFKVIYRYDHSRSWKPRRGVDEQSATARNARPLRISVWYPARKTAGSRKVLYGDYVFYKATGGDFAHANKMIEERDVASFRRVLKNSDQVFKELMTTPMAARRDAPPIGKFPLVVYSSGLNDVSSSNVVLYEYLASHGYIVATVPQLGTTSDGVNLGINPIDLETQVRDLEFALGEMDEFPGVDNTRLAVAGHSMGGIAALILQFRNANVDAVIGLDASYGSGSLAGLLTRSPYYQPERMRVPFLDLRRPSDEVDLSSVNIFRYADKYFLGFPGIYHGDFTSFPMIALRFPTDIQNRTPETANRGYQLVCRYVLNFLNAYLKQDAAGLKFISDRPEANGIPTGVVRYEFRKGLQAPPTEQEFVQSIQRDGLQQAIDLYRKFKMREPQQPIVNEGVLNTLGYALLGSGQLSQAINVFRLNVEAHPTSANAYDSLADGYVRNGNKIEAIHQYEKVLEVLPNDKNASEEQKKSLRKTALEELKRLRQ